MVVGLLVIGDWLLIVGLLVIGYWLLKKGERQVCEECFRLRQAAAARANSPPAFNTRNLSSGLVALDALCSTGQKKAEPPPPAAKYLTIIC